MDSNENVEEAVDVLQQLGLKEYEAKCFVGLTRVDSGTARKLGEITDVPRTRVYDAIRVLEAQGLVEVQHSSPQQYRAVPLDEATATLRDQYQQRVDRLRGALDQIPEVDADSDSTKQEVWALSGSSAIANRAIDMIGQASEEVVLVVGEESLLDEDLVAALNGAATEEDVLVGAVTPELRAHIDDVVPEAETFVSGLEWLHATDDGDEEAAIGRMLLVDRSALFVSSITPTTGTEKAVFGSGFGNGLVVVSRRLMAQGLIPARDPGRDGAS